MRRRGRPQRGIFLVQAMLLVLVFALIGAALSTLTLSRAAVVAGSIDAQRRRWTVQAAESRVLDCLRGSAVGRESCAASASTACLPTSIDGRRVSVRVSGEPPLCHLEVTVHE